LLKWVGCAARASLLRMGIIGMGDFSLQDVTFRSVIWQHMV